MNGICSCEDENYVSLGRPNCVIEMQSIAFPIIYPRFAKDGTRNVIDLGSATLGQDIRNLVETELDGSKRLVPFPKTENASFDRTETVYETAPSTTKYKIEGVGGVRTMKFELWGKSAVHEILRQLETIGCNDMDILLVDVAGNLWGIKDNPLSNELRGYEMSSETFDAFKMYATDTTKQKIMISFDLERTEIESRSYALTPQELGYSATTLKSLIPVVYQVTTPTATSIILNIGHNFGSALSQVPILGLTATNFDLTINGATVVPTVTTVVDGRYVLTVPTMTVGQSIVLVVKDVPGFAPFEYNTTYTV